MRAEWHPVKDCVGHGHGSRLCLLEWRPHWSIVIHKLIIPHCRYKAAGRLQTFFEQYLAANVVQA